jgi:hypothetical protein
MNACRVRGRMKRFLLAIFFINKFSSCEKHRLLAPDPNERAANPNQKSVLEFFRQKDCYIDFLIKILYNIFILKIRNKGDLKNDENYFW